MKKIIPLVLAIVLVGLAGQSAFGCSCMVESEKKKIDYKKWAKGFDGAAFKGRVVSIDADLAKKQLKVTFAVDSFWRGVESARVVVYTAIDGAMCGVSYEIGKEYVIIADRSERKLKTNLCSDLDYQSNLKGYLKALGKAKRLPKAAAGEAEDRQNAGRSRLLSEMVDGNCEDELARLDMLAYELRGNPGSMAYLIAYGGKEGKKDEAKALLARMSYYLSNNSGAPKPIIVDGGFREKVSVAFWVYFPGELLPMPKPTINVKDAKLKGSEKIRGYNCADEMGDQ